MSNFCVCHFPAILSYADLFLLDVSFITVDFAFPYLIQYVRNASELLKTIDERTAPKVEAEEQAGDANQMMMGQGMLALGNAPFNPAGGMGGMQGGMGGMQGGMGGMQGMGGMNGGMMQPNTMGGGF